VLQQVVGQVDAAILLVDEAIAPPLRGGGTRTAQAQRQQCGPHPSFPDRLHVIVLSLCR
jgi:hypothetical protein